MKQVQLVEAFFRKRGTLEGRFFQLRLLSLGCSRSRALEEPRRLNYVRTTNPELFLWKTP